jgi:SAM-dependent methyltransferase
MSDQFYRAFEDLHRGTRDLIKSRLLAYEPFVLPLVANGRPARALDLGCGRGEWLELLGELGFGATGVDLDDGMLAACRERGLDVHTADALAALRAQPDASLALVSCFHLVEHLPFDVVQQLIAESLRVLQPGGLLVMETPNPENLVVGSCAFYLDPSHVKPLPPKLLSFATEFAGFARNKVVRLQEAAQLHQEGAVTLFNVLDGVSPDYSVVAQKDGPDAALCDAAFASPFGLDLHTLAQRYDGQHGAALSQLGAQLDALGTEQGNASEINERRSQEVNKGLAYLDQRMAETSTLIGQQLSRLDQASAHMEQELAQVAPLADRLAALEQQLRDVEQRRARAEELAQTESVAALELRLKFLEQGQEHDTTLGKASAVHAALAELTKEVEQLRARAQAAESDAAAAQRHSAEVGVWARSMEQQLLAVYARTSWRLSQPIRTLGNLIRPAQLKALVKSAIKGLLRRIVARLAASQSARRLIAPLRHRFPALNRRLLRVTAALRRGVPDPGGGFTAMPESPEEQANPLPLAARQVLADLKRTLSNK